MIEPNPNVNNSSGLEVLSAKRLFGDSNGFHQNKIPSLTKLENGNTQAVMDGSLDQFMRSYLLTTINNKKDTVEE